MAKRVGGGGWSKCDRLSERELIKLRKYDVLTTGLMALVCRVAPRTVSKWCDSGRLKCYRIPGGQDRRITRAEAVRFLKENGMPLNELGMVAPVLACLTARTDQAEALASHMGKEWSVRPAQTGFALAMTLVSELPAVVLADWSAGAMECLSVLDACKALKTRPPVIGIGTDDRPAQELLQHGCTSAFLWGEGPAAIAKGVEDAYKAHTRGVSLAGSCDGRPRRRPTEPAQEPAPDILPMPGKEAV